MDPNAKIAAITVVLLIVGKLIKDFTPIKNDFIPGILLFVGTILHVSATGGAWSDLWAWVGSLIFAAGATGLHQAAKSVSPSGLKGGTSLFALCGMITLIGAIGVTTGCMTNRCDPSSPDYEACVEAARAAEVEAWALDLRDVAEAAVPDIIKKNPDLRDEIELAVDKLTILERTENLSIETLVEALKDSGIAELSGPEGQYAITLTRIVIRRVGRATGTVGNPDEVRTIARGLRDGIAAGLAAVQ